MAYCIIFLAYLDCLISVLVSDSTEMNQILGSDAFGFNSPLAMANTLSRIFSCDAIPILMILMLISSLFDVFCEYSKCLRLSQPFSLKKFLQIYQDDLRL